MTASQTTSLVPSNQGRSWPQSVVSIVQRFPAPLESGCLRTKTGRCWTWCGPCGGRNDKRLGTRRCEFRSAHYCSTLAWPSRGGRRIKARALDVKTRWGAGLFLLNPRHARSPLSRNLLTSQYSPIVPLRTRTNRARRAYLLPGPLDACRTHIITSEQTLHLWHSLDTIYF